IYFVDRNGLAVSVHRYDYAKSNRRFGGFDYDDEYSKHRAWKRIYRKPLDPKRFLVQLEITRECNQVEIYRVQNQLDRHKDDDDVAARQDPCDSNNEQKKAQHQEVDESGLETFQKWLLSL